MEQGVREKLNLRSQLIVGWGALTSTWQAAPAREQRSGGTSKGRKLEQGWEDRKEKPGETRQGGSRRHARSTLRRNEASPTFLGDEAAAGQEQRGGRSGTGLGGEVCVGCLGTWGGSSGCSKGKPCCRKPELQTKPSQLRAR